MLWRHSSPNKHYIHHLFANGGLSLYLYCLFSHIINCSNLYTGSIYCRTCSLDCKVTLW